MEKIHELMLGLPVWAQVLISVLGGVSIVATAVVRVTPSKSDDAKVGKLIDGFWKVVKWLPTVGVNPRTKALEEALKDAKGK